MSMESAKAFIDRMKTDDELEAVAGGATVTMIPCEEDEKGCRGYGYV